VILVIGSYQPNAEELKFLHKYMTDNPKEQYLVGDSKGIETAAYVIGQISDIEVNRILTNWGNDNAIETRNKYLIESLPPTDRKVLVTVPDEIKNTNQQKLFMAAVMAGAAIIRPEAVNNV